MLMKNGLFKKVAIVWIESWICMLGLEILRYLGTYCVLKLIIAFIMIYYYVAECEFSMKNT